MSDRYVSFSRKQFEFGLIQVANEIRTKVGGWSDITEEYLRDNPETYERVYRFRTNKKGVEVIIFSSIPVDNERVRSLGSDSVKLVYRWKNSNGDYEYARGRHHYRTQNLLGNMKKSLIEMCTGSNKQ